MANSSNSPLSRRERGEQAAVSISARWKGSHYLDACTAALEYGYLVAARLLDYERAHQLFKQNYFVLRDLSAERWQDVRDAFGHGTSIDAKLNDAWTRYAPVANDNIRFDVTWFDDVDELVTKEEIVKGFLGAGEFSLFVAKPGTAKSVREPDAKPGTYDRVFRRAVTDLTEGGKVGEVDGWFWPKGGQSPDMSGQ
jgi:hypothetical protein